MFDSSPKVSESSSRPGGVRRTVNTQPWRGGARVGARAAVCLPGGLAESNRAPWRPALGPGGSQFAAIAANCPRSLGAEAAGPDCAGARLAQGQLPAAARPEALPRRAAVARSTAPHRQCPGVQQGCLAGAADLTAHSGKGVALKPLAQSIAPMQRSHNRFRRAPDRRTETAMRWQSDMLSRVRAVLPFPCLQFTSGRLISAIHLPPGLTRERQVEKLRHCHKFGAAAGRSRHRRVEDEGASGPISGRSETFVYAQEGAGLEDCTVGAKM